MASLHSCNILSTIRATDVLQPARTQNSSMCNAFGVHVLCILATFWEPHGMVLVLQFVLQIY